MFDPVLARTGVGAEGVIHVGDEPVYDIEGAHNANLRAVWVNRKARDWPATQRPPHAEITTLEALPGVIEQLAATAAAERMTR
jgi:putative hydrolase of the HAD superfamily